MKYAPCVPPSSIILNSHGSNKLVSHSCLLRAGHMTGKGSAVKYGPFRGSRCIANVCVYVHFPRPSGPLAAVEKLFAEMPADEQTALWKAKEDVYRLISTKMTPLPGLLDFLERCEAAGLAMILVTNAPRLDAIHTLKVLDLSHRSAVRLPGFAHAFGGHY